MTPEETQSMQNVLRRNHDIFAWTHADMKGIHPSITSHRLNVFPTARPISSLMTPEETQSMQNVLRRNHDIFAWTHADMKGIHPSITSHRLNVFPTARPVRQKIRRFHPDRQKVIRNEIDKLLEAGFIREVDYPDWLANVVVFPFATNKSNLDSTIGQEMLSFLDAFSGYHQIPMSPTDEEKTAFITPYDLYCYKIIKTREEHVLHLQEVFYLLRKYDMRLNPSKCAFGVSASKFLGFMVSQRGIEVCPDQIKAVMKTPPPRSKKELQRLTGKRVALGRFIARFTDELRPFFLAIRKAGTSGWTDNCQNAFEKIKHCLMQPPILSCPIPKEKLYMYLAWTLRVDGASRSSGSGVGLLLQSPTEEHLEQAIRLGFPASNNEAEYEAILSGLNLALALSVTKLRVYSDSQLVVRHVQKEYKAKDARMTQYLTKVKDTLQRFTEWTIEKIKRTENRRVDALAGIAASLPIKEAILLPIHVQTNSSVAETSTCNTIEARQADNQEWTNNIAEYLQTGTSPGDPREAHKVRIQAARFTIIGGTCTSNPSQDPTFDYFSKWVEAEAYASIKDKDVTKFVWKNIVCRFGIPHTIIVDNGPQFDNIAFRNFYSELNIRNSYSTPRYLQSNGQVEATNKTLITALKKRLEQAKGKWVEELPGVLWAYRTTPGRPTGNTPFVLAYGMNAVIPTEIGLPTIWTEAAKQDDASTELGRNLDWADEVRESAAIRMADYQQRASAHYNRKVRQRSFKNGTLVLRKVFENTAETGAGKFQANWEGPYIVSKSSENGAYHLQKLDGTPLLKPWNGSNLKQYYQ
ncbi:Transposon Tf2-8 polyprotein [Vitis vinifera]|uniref:Transposon Tf2-8 polyprotein n=1 Tax=Vitis vinifera TaxID=29760 RepID=A0A438F0T1_VITVI|nr:Transposon Tf2-8 polyprotein [Vitis vinifera]